MAHECVVVEGRHVQLGIASIPPRRLDANRHRPDQHTRRSAVPSNHHDSGPQYCNLLSYTGAQQTILVDGVLCATGRRTSRLLPRLIYTTPNPDQHDPRTVGGGLMEPSFRGPSAVSLAQLGRHDTPSTCPVWSQSTQNCRHRII